MNRDPRDINCWYKNNQYTDIRDCKITAKVDEKHLWGRFKNHHYMSHTLPPGSKFWTFYITINGEERLIACLGTILQVHKLPAKRVTRFVVLPEYQGLGFSTRILNAIAEYYRRLYYILFIVTFHPRLGRSLENGPWTPSIYNGRSYAVHKQSVQNHNTSNNIRAGTSMFRYKYLPDTDYVYPIDVIDESDFTDIELRKLAHDDDIRYRFLVEYKKTQKELRRQKKKQEHELELDKQCVKGPLKSIPGVPAMKRNKRERTKAVPPSKR